MADDKLKGLDNTNLPAAIQGDGRKFISLLKAYLGDIKDTINVFTAYFNSTGENVGTTDSQVKRLSVKEQAVNGNVSLTVKWSTEGYTSYDGATIKVKESKNPLETEWNTIEVTRTYFTQGNEFTIENCTIGHNYQIAVIGKNKLNELSDEHHAPSIEHYISAVDNTPDSPYDFQVTFSHTGCRWDWKQHQQTNVIWTELRLDTNVGQTFNRLDTTSDLFSTAKPLYRNGKAYLYNMGVGSAYSAPAIINYTVPVPVKATNVKVQPVFDGLIISWDKAPQGCFVTVYINGEPYRCEDDKYHHLCSTGSYNIQVAYTDVFGEGEKSDLVTQKTLEEIPPDAVHITNQTVFDNGVIVGKYIGDHEVVGTKIQDGAITTDKIAANAVTASTIAANAITTDKIAAGSVTTNSMAANSINGNRITVGTLTGDKISANSITGDKIATNTITAQNIASGSITSDKISAGAITGDKIHVKSLDSISATIGTFKSAETGARLVIKDNILEVYDENNVCRVRIGVF